jgi:hypothetical protein
MLDFLSNQFWMPWGLIIPDNWLQIEGKVTIFSTFGVKKFILHLMSMWTIRKKQLSSNSLSNFIGLGGG